MNVAVEAMRNKEMGSYKTSSVFNLPLKHYRFMLKTGRKAQMKQ